VWRVCRGAGASIFDAFRSLRRGVVAEEIWR